MSNELRKLLSDVGEVEASRWERVAPWLVVAAHPDDETLGASWILQHIENVYVLHVTDGAPRDPALRPKRVLGPREFYAAQRAAEVRKALALAGVPHTRVRGFGLCDQSASLHLVSLTQRVERVIEALQPAVVVSHPYEGGHPDHDATAFAVQVATQRLQRAGAHVPLRLEMTSYHRHHGSLHTGEFLPANTQEAERVLNARERELKRRMMECFATQVDALSLFHVDSERFRASPAYDFRAPPVTEPLHYESLGWPLDGQHWRELATQALERLDPAA